MKRDMDLVRKILVAMETSEHGFVDPQLTIPGHTDEEIGYHVYLMDQAGLIIALPGSTRDLGSPSPFPRTLTWQGHEFLDAARNDTLWQRAKSKVAAVTGGLSLELLKETLLELARSGIAQAS